MAKVDLHKLSIKGGPSPAGLEVQLDGEPLRGRRVELVASATDVVRAVVYAIVSVDVDVDAETLDGGYKATVKVARETFHNESARVVEWDDLCVGSGQTVGQALMDAADRALELES